MSRQLKPCGTYAGAARHKANGEDPCGPCVEARRQYDRGRWLRRKAKRPAPKRKPTLRDRLLSKAIINWQTGCWEWSGLKMPSGYGQISENGIHRIAHRVAYELIEGPIPDGLQLDHLCRVRHCMNPAHLEPVTPRVNVLRSTSFSAANAVKTHCPAGHEYTPENTYQRRDRNGRLCRPCRQAVYLASKKRKAEQVAAEALEETAGGAS